MKIALINENSQAAKNEIIYNSLKNTVEPMGHEVLNFGMYSADDETQLTYVMNGLLAAILLNSKAVDFVVTGCGTGSAGCSGAGGCGSAGFSSVITRVGSSTAGAAVFPSVMMRVGSSTTGSIGAAGFAAGAARGSGAPSSSGT